MELLVRKLLLLISLFLLTMICSAQIVRISPRLQQNLTLTTTTTTRPTFDQLVAQARAKLVGRGTGQSSSLTLPDVKPRIVPGKLTFDVDVDADSDDQTHEFFLPRQTFIKSASNSVNDEEWHLISSINNDNTAVKRFDQKQSQRQRQSRVCDGTNNQFSTAADERVRYRQLQNRYENCHIVDGNLELTFLPAGYDYSFLASIREVTGYVLISNCNVSVLSLSSLSIIRGRAVLDFGPNAKDENLALYVTNNQFLSILDFHSLREIVRGRVSIVNNPALCFVNTVDWSDIVNDDDNEQETAAAVVLQNNALESVCQLRGICSDRCPRIKRKTSTDVKVNFPSAAAASSSCWGPKPEQCQRRNKRNCADQCQGGRCFGPDARQCCHAYCAGGCFGPLQSDCFSCRHFDNNGTCVLECPPPQIYDPNSYQLRPNPHARYAYGSQCVAECPRHLLRDGGACVGKCPSGKHEVEGHGRCEPCPNGECAKNCTISDSTSSNSDDTYINANNINRFANCTVIQGDIVILQSTFDGIVIFEDEQTGKPLEQPKQIAKLDPSALDVLRNVHEVTGSVIIEGAHPNLRSLSFLSNLRVIYGRNARKHDDETFYSLRVIASPYLERLDLRSLELINSGGVLISRNPRLCLAESIDWQSVINDGNNRSSSSNSRRNDEHQRKIVVSDNSPLSNCSARGLTCNDQCDQRAGCWGPKPTQCKKCKRFVLFGNDETVAVENDHLVGRRRERRCITNCSMPGVYFNPQHPVIIPSLAQSTASNVQNICHRCHEQCADNCYGPGPGNCTKCKLARDGPFCVGQCPMSKYLNISAGQCEMCHLNCLDGCRGPQNTIGSNGCNSCAVAVLNADSNEVVDKCQPAGSSCPWEYYAEYVQRAMQNKKSGGALSALVGRIVCRKCDPLCARCSREGVECDECRYFRQQETGICVEKCGDGFWTNTTDRTCQRCHPQCDGCRNGSGSEDCLRCRNVRVYAAESSVFHSGDTFNCSDKCPPSMPYKSLLTGLTDDAVCTSNSSASYLASPRSRGSLLIYLLIGGGVCITGFAIFVIIAGWYSRRRNNTSNIALRAKQLALQLSPHAADDLLGNNGNQRKGEKWDATLGSNTLASKPSRELQIIKVTEITLAEHPLGSGAFGFVKQGIWKVPQKDGEYHSADGSKHVRKASATSSSSNNSNENGDLCKNKKFSANSENEEDALSCADSASTALAASATAGRFAKKSKTRKNAAATLGSSHRYGNSKSPVLKVPVAVKQLNEVLTAETNDHFMDEACMIAQLKHKHLLPLLGVVITEQPMLVTPLMPYGSIQDYLKEYRRNNSVITAPQMMSWFLQMAEGMKFLEENKVVHRDLAARNVLLQTPTFCRIADFGLAKLLGLEENIYLATPGSKLPLRWLALESLTYSQFTHKSDVWAYGITLWEILMFGAKPYDEWADFKPEILAQRLLVGERLPQPPTSSVSMFTLLAKCWAQKPEARPSFDMLVKQLEHLSRAPLAHISVPGHRTHRPSINGISTCAGFDATDSIADQLRRSSVLLYSSEHNSGASNSNYPPATYTNGNAFPSAGRQNPPAKLTLINPANKHGTAKQQYSPAEYGVSPAATVSSALQQPYRASTTGRPRSLRLASATTITAAPPVLLSPKHLMLAAARAQSKTGAAQNIAYFGPASPVKAGTTDQRAAQQKLGVRRASESVTTALQNTATTNADYALNGRPARPQRLRLPVLSTADQLPQQLRSTLAEYSNNKSPGVISNNARFKPQTSAEHPYDDVCAFDGHISDSVFDTSSEAAGRTPTTHLSYAPPFSAQPGTTFVFPPTSTFSPTVYNSNNLNRRSIHNSGNFSTFSATQLSSSFLLGQNLRLLEQQPQLQHYQQPLSLQNSPVRKVFCESQPTIQPQRRLAWCAPAGSYYRGGAQVQGQTLASPLPLNVIGPSP